MKILDNVVSVVVLLIILLLIIPLNPVILDLMFIMNIAVSLVILLTSMYIKESLQFSIFPSILLITTLLRLSLNISSTRQILGNEGDAGNVIKTFGDFVIGGEPVIGFIIFLLIVIVQFVVITKGSERVAEVSARFTLDAMPGKQMAIDADLSSGLINEDEARTRRKNIQREADFFGAMDGASKFVKGDAIFSIIATIVNLIGGVIIGFMDGGDFASVLATYSVATVGDGLVSQIPALLISTATGMIVTRAASETSLNLELGKQLLSQPKVLVISGGIILAMMLIPGFPKMILLLVGGLLIFLGMTLMNAERKPKVGLATTAGGATGAVGATDQPLPVSEMEFYRDIDNVYSLLNVEQIEIEFGYSLIPLVDEISGGNFIDRIVMFRKQFATDMGMVVPSIRIRENGTISPNQYIIKIKGEEVAAADVLTDHYLALDSGEVDVELDGIDTIEPAFNIPAKWISEDRRAAAELAGYTLIDPTSVIITHLSEIVKRHAHELINRADVLQLLENVKKFAPNLVDDVIPSLMSMIEFQRVLGSLLAEGVPIRDLPTILETLAEYAPTIKDNDTICEFVRQALKRTITRRFSDGNQLRVLTLDPEIENMILNSVKKSERGTYLALEPDVIQKIIQALVEQTGRIREVVQTPIVLTAPVARVYFRKICEQFAPGTVVLSFNEIESSVQIQALGNIAIA